MERIWAEDTEGHILVTEADEPMRQDVYIDGVPPVGYTSNAFY
jgi:hypothetical protein